MDGDDRNQPMTKAAIRLFLALVAALALTACAGGGSHPVSTGTASGGTVSRGTVSGGTGSGTPARPSAPAASGYDEGLAAVVDPSGARGGTLTFDLAGTPDSLDYQDTSDAFMWDFARLYSMQLMTYRSCPGACGRQLVPDLATRLGQVSDHGLVWTYHIRPGVRFENGQPVTAQDVKYGIERTYARTVLPFGPDSFQVLLADNGYGGPYASAGASLTSITTPDPATIQFHLAAPFPDFDYVVATPESTPVPPGWDTGPHRGAGFGLHPISSGPYRFASYTPGQRLVLVPNPYWRQASDPQARQLAAAIVVNLNVGAAAADASLLAGRADLDLSGGGLQPPTAARVLRSPALRANADDPLTGLLHFAYLNVRVIPDVHCREAIEYAADRLRLQAAYGGAAGAEIAATVLPPDVDGHQHADAYHALTNPGGDDAAAAAQLRLCGAPRGFATGLAYRTDQPGDAAAARALQVSLAAVRIRAQLHGYSSAAFYTTTAGYPRYAVSHALGISIGGWRPQWPDGFAFLAELADGTTIAYRGGNANIAQLNDAIINALFARAATIDDAAARDAIWAQIDRRILAVAAIMPIADQKVLLYRDPAITNVYADQAYGMYNYAVLGVR
jgi:peptide/nickel transport system substrate-binding protein